MAKKKEQTSRQPTRRQIARSKKEREKLKLIYMALGGVGILVLIVLAFGLIQTFVIEPNSPVAIVDGTEITTREYRNRVRYERFLLNEQLAQIQQQLLALPETTEEGDQFTELLRNQYQQLANQVFQQLSLVDRQTVDILIEEELVLAEAQERNISVTEDEVTEQINRQLAQRVGGLTAAAVSETSTARAEASATAALWTPTPTFTPSPTLTVTEEITPTATPANTPTPAPTPTPNIIPESDLSTQYNEWINTLAENTGLDEAQYRDIIRNNLFRVKLQEALGEEVPRVEEQSRARHILVETEEEAQEVIDRLEAGEDFAALAEEVSQDPGSAANGGDLGFVARGRFVPPVDEAVFTLPVGEVSDPVESSFGWHVIEVLEREERELSPSAYSQRQQEAFANWASEARNAATIEDLWTPDKVPAE